MVKPYGARRSSSVSSTLGRVEGKVGLVGRPRGRPGMVLGGGCMELSGSS